MDRTEQMIQMVELMHTIEAQSIRTDNLAEYLKAETTLPEIPAYELKEIDE